jgi:hypothetical protein
MPAPAPDPLVVWGIAVRAIALVYGIAFWTLHREVLALCGSRGITPVALALTRMRRDMGLVTSVLRHPSVLWLSCRDGELVWLARAGMAAAACAAAGVASRPMLAAAWIAYLSFDVAIGLTYPWESMLFEAGLLAILLPPLEPLPGLRMAASPDPLLMWLFQWLLFRVLFGFGKNKFTRDATGDPLYLRSFLISQLLVSPLGWRAWRLPRPLLVASHWLLFAVEMILPFFVFFAGWPRLAAAAGFCGLMIFIQAMGSFGYFNVLVIALSVTLLDPRSLSLASIRASGLSGHWPIAVIAAWLGIAGLFQLPFNTWVSRGWLEWPAWGALPRFWRAVLAILRAAMPWRTVHAYGVFPPRIGPPVKWIPVVEGTRDGQRWEPYEYRYMPSTPASPPRFVAPHTPRLDHFASYDGLGVDRSNLLGTIFSQGSPYHFAPASPDDRLLQRLLEPRGPVHGLFRHVPFDTPPLQVRMRLFAFTPTSPADLARTGCYWHVDLVGEQAPARGADPTVWTRAVPAPEQFHPDERWARRRVRRLAPLLRASSLADVRAALDEESRRRWPEFWTAVVPRVRGACDAGWVAVDRLARDLLEEFGPPGVDVFDRIRGAVATALLERIEPRVLTRGPERIEPRSYFHVSLWAHAGIAGDQARIEGALADPWSVDAADVNAPEVQSLGLMVWTVLRRDLMTLHARKQRLLACLQIPDLPPSPVIPGFPLALPTLAAALPDRDERLPALEMLPDGNWTYNGTRVLDR